MNILVIAKLTPDKLLTKIRPFLDNSKIEHIFILRDEGFETIEKKIAFLPSPKKKGILRHIEKIKIAKAFSKEHPIDIVLSYLLIPHGYIGWLLSIMLKSKWIHAIIAGHREVCRNGRIIEIINLFVLKYADAIIAMGQATKSYLIDNGIKECMISVIPNAIDSHYFCPPMLKSIKYDVLYASRIDENKNFPLLIRAIDKLKAQFPELKVCVAGYGEKLDEVRRMVHQKGLDNFFLFLGRVDHQLIKDLYYQSRIFVLTSRSEGVPMALIEAMACKVACISTNVGEIGSIIKDGENGFLLNNTEDDSLLAERIKMLLTNQDLLDLISKNATKIKETYSLDYASNLWIKVVNSLFAN